MKAFAIKRLDSSQYWTGKAWGPSNKAKEWNKEATANKHAKQVSASLPNVHIAVVQTV